MIDYSKHVFTVYPLAINSGLVLPTICRLRLSSSLIKILFAGTLYTSADDAQLHRVGYRRGIVHVISRSFVFSPVLCVNVCTPPVITDNASRTNVHNFYFKNIDDTVLEKVR